MTKQDLLPCPGCGNTEPLEIVDAADMGDYDIEGITIVCSVLNRGCGWHGPYQETSDEARKAWNTRQPSSQWVAVSERLPDKNTEVLAFVGGYYVQAYYGVGLDGDYNNPGWNPSYGQAAIWSSDVTHWMPLPPPPTLEDAQGGGE